MNHIKIIVLLALVSNYYFCVCSDTCVRGHHDTLPYDGYLLRPKDQSLVSTLKP